MITIFKYINLKDCLDNDILKHNEKFYRYFDNIKSSYFDISDTPSYDESYNDSDEEELENQIKMRILNNRLTKYFITIGNSLPADIVNALKKYRDNNEYFKLCSD